MAKGCLLIKLLTSVKFVSDHFEKFDEVYLWVIEIRMSNFVLPIFLTYSLKKNYFAPGCASQVYYYYLYYENMIITLCDVRNVVTEKLLTSVHAKNNNPVIRALS